MLNIERQDKQPDPRDDELKRDWRAWANKNGYTRTSSIPVTHGGMTVTLEIWENPIAQKDAYLVYIPPIPKTVGGETLYIITDQDYFAFMIESAKKLVAAALVMVEAKMDARKYRLN